MVAQVRESESAPQWICEVMDKFNSGIAHAFLLSGNVEDCIGLTHGTNLRSYLINFYASYEVVVVYNRASGFYFPYPNHRRRFLEAIGLISRAQPALGQSSATTTTTGRCTRSCTGSRCC